MEKASTKQENIHLEKLDIKGGLWWIMLPEIEACNVSYFLSAKHYQEINLQDNNILQNGLELVFFQRRHTIES